MFYNDNDRAFHARCIGTELKFVLIPKICYITGKYLWLKRAYKQTAMYTGPGDPVFEHRWYEKSEFLFERMKGNL
jgi:hypothetical protein